MNKNKAKLINNGHHDRIYYFSMQNMLKVLFKEYC